MPKAKLVRRPRAIVGKQKSAMEGGPLFGLVDIGLDDGAHLAAGDHRKVGLGKERRPARRRAFLGIDQRLAVRHGGGRLEIVLGEVLFVGVAFRQIVRDEARRAVGIVDLEQEDLAELLHLVEVGPVGGGGRGAGRDGVEVIDGAGDALRPDATGRNRVGVEEPIDRDALDQHRPAENGNDAGKEHDRIPTRGTHRTQSP